MKLLDAHALNERQKITNPMVTTIAVPWDFESFVSFHSLIHN